MTFAIAPEKPPLRQLNWREIQEKGGGSKESWLVIDRLVYDITRFRWRHPGGSRLIAHYAGQDATDAFRAFHIDSHFVRRYLRPLLIGELGPREPSQEPSKDRSVVEDFRRLRGVVEGLGLLRPRPLFFTGTLLHILALDLAAWLTLWLWGPSWGPFIITALLLATVQAQAGWLQHDFGHLSVFGTSRWNHLAHRFVIGHLKGAPASWWNHLHLQHHAKPNCYRKDPDINLHPLPFTLGTTLSTELGTQKKKFMPYQHQHKYFFFLGPPALIPLYFQWYVFYFVIKHHQWQDLTWMMSFYVRFTLCYLPLLGLPSFISLFFLVRVLESNWFVWVTQMSHIPMHIDRDQNKDWVTMQVEATCNVEQSLLNDWFTGHLNFQIEHHLFPTMPRHNYHAVAPLVRSFCERHDLSYNCKSLHTAFADIIRSLKSSGEIWMDAYLHK